MFGYISKLLKKVFAKNTANMSRHPSGTVIIWRGSSSSIGDAIESVVDGWSSSGLCVKIAGSWFKASYVIVLDTVGEPSRVSEKSFQDTIGGRLRDLVLPIVQKTVPLKTSLSIQSLIADEIYLALNMTDYAYIPIKLEEEMREKITPMVEPIWIKCSAKDWSAKFGGRPADITNTIAQCGTLVGGMANAPTYRDVVFKDMNDLDTPFTAPDLKPSDISANADYPAKTDKINPEGFAPTIDPNVTVMDQKTGEEVNVNLATLGIVSRESNPHVVHFGIGSPLGEALSARIANTYSTPRWYM